MSRYTLKYYKHYGIAFCDSITGIRIPLNAIPDTVNLGNLIQYLDQQIQTILDYPPLLF